MPKALYKFKKKLGDEKRRVKIVAALAQIDPFLSYVYVFSSVYLTVQLFLSSTLGSKEFLPHVALSFSAPHFLTLYSFVLFFPYHPDTSLTVVKEQRK